jgi:hypothetical protein
MRNVPALKSIEALTVWFEMEPEGETYQVQPYQESPMILNREAMLKLNRDHVLPNGEPMPVDLMMASGHEDFGIEENDYADFDMNTFLTTH